MTADPGQEDLTGDDHLVVDTVKDDPQGLDDALIQPVQDPAALYADDNATPAVYPPNAEDLGR